jgi:4-amino-4-deoxy-L-arabinose transferase-like glycosyltransferase
MSLLAQQQSRAYSARLSASWQPLWLTLARRTDVQLAIVLVVCFIPRAIAAWRLPAVCDDAYYYLHVADSLDKGRLARAMEYLNINVYPMVLIGLHRLGLDWIFAAKFWGVLTGTAVVLPLFDLLRRMFDKRIALVAIFLYAVHPRIVEPTVEPLRESTFWLFFVLCLDLYWRAACEFRWWQFAAGGLSLALALHTRMEGWYLLAPLGVWLIAAWRSHPEARPRLATGAIASLAITPLFVLVVNLTLLAHQTQWELGRLSPFALVANWVHPVHKSPVLAPATPPPAVSQSANPPAVPASAPSVPHAEGAKSTMETTTVAATLRLYLYEMVRTLGYAFLALTLLGLIRGRREFLDPRKAVLGLLTAVVLLAIWVRVSQIGTMNGRYFLILVFLDAPFAAIGALEVMRGFEKAAWRRGLAWLSPGRASVAFAICLLAAGWAEALLAHHSHRHREAQLGRWIARQSGHFDSVVADFNSVRPAYVAGCGMPDVVTFDEFYEQRFDRSPPDLAIFYPDGFRKALLPDLIVRAAELGLTPLDLAGFAKGKAEFVVFVRTRR